MGNRAIITTQRKNLGVYLHWNGGRDSVEGFLAYCKLQGYRGALSDESYAFARLAQVIGNFFGGSTSVGITTSIGSVGDNGIYIIDDNWEIVGREDIDKRFVEQQAYDFKDIVCAIDERQPEHIRLGESYLAAEQVEASELKIGDIILQRISDTQPIQEIYVQGMWTEELSKAFEIYPNGIGKPYGLIKNRYSFEPDGKVSPELFSGTVRRKR